MADTDQVLNLAAIIRKVDGNPSKGAAALAESILDHPRFRAALGEADEPVMPEGREPASVTGEPSDEEIMGLMPQQMHEDLAAAVRAMAEQQGIDSTPAKGAMRIILNRHVVDLARAVLARWGHQPAPPSDGEVAELVAWLREQLHVCLQAPWTPGIKHFGCAAELLERLSPPQPVPVSERLPGPEDCVPHPRTKRGNWCWGFERCEVSLARPARWRLMHMEAVEMEASHWLPAHALPLPEVGE